MASPGQALLARLWWGPLRRPFEALARRTVGERIVAGPLRGRRFAGGLAHRLGIYELAVQDALYRLLRPEDVFYDVGGHRGYFALLAAAAVGDGGRVFVFEPLPENFEALGEALAASGAVNVELFPWAISDSSGTARLFAPEEATPVASLIPDAGPRSLEVATTSLDRFSEDHPPPDLCKVDVEGAEDRVLRGARRLLESAAPPRWLIEVHSAVKHEAVTETLSARGYRLRELPPPRRRAPYPRHLVARFQEDATERP